MLLLSAVGLLAGLLSGFVLHEVAHWVVLRGAGYDASLSLWPPVVDGWTSEYPAPPAVRLAAGAPALLGLAVGSVGVGVSVHMPLLFPAVVGAVVRLCWLSPADRDIALKGRPRTDGYGGT